MEIRPSHCLNENSCLDCNYLSEISLSQNWSEITYKILTCSLSQNRSKISGRSPRLTSLSHTYSHPLLSSSRLPGCPLPSRLPFLFSCSFWAARPSVSIFLSSLPLVIHSPSKLPPHGCAPRLTRFTHDPLLYMTTFLFILRGFFFSFNKGF